MHCQVTYPTLSRVTDHLEQIRDAIARRDQALIDRDAAMRAARAAGHTWAAIAEAAHLTPHGVRFALGRKRDEKAADR